MDTDTLNFDSQEPEVPESIETSTGTSKVLGMFFGMVVVCAVFFAFGFTLGRNATASEVKAAPPEIASQPANAASAEKPSPIGVADTTAQQDLTFQTSLESKQSEPTLAPASVEPAPRPATKVRTSMPSGYVVQIAALTKAGDADALVSVLRRKKYPVFLVNTSPSDRFYRVQVGPFSDIKDAETMRSRLARDGYKPILKQ
ncbi:MAG: SPOR domain-containing protein [Acidobacteria bacterium]|nr:SPOR domain-containing protein [Acidobacteriota bacterium]